MLSSYQFSNQSIERWNASDRSRVKLQEKRRGASLLRSGSIGRYWLSAARSACRRDNRKTKFSRVGRGEEGGIYNGAGIDIRRFYSILELF